MNERLFFELVNLYVLCQQIPLMRKVHLEHQYLPPAEIQPFNVYEIIEFLLKRLFI